MNKNYKLRLFLGVSTVALLFFFMIVANVNRVQSVQAEENQQCQLPAKVVGFGDGGIVIIQFPEDTNINDIISVGDTGIWVPNGYPMQWEPPIQFPEHDDCP